MNDFQVHRLIFTNLEIRVWQWCHLFPVALTGQYNSETVTMRRNRYFGKQNIEECWTLLWMWKWRSKIYLKPWSHCADYSLPMFPIIEDCPDLSWSWQNHQFVALTPDLCLSKTACTILVRQLYDTGVWSALSTFSTIISTTTDTIDTTALRMLTTTPTLLPICYHD